MLKALKTKSSIKHDSKPNSCENIQLGAGVDSHPAYFSPSFLHHNGKVSAALQLYCRPGTNRYLDFADVLDIIPISSGNVDLTFIADDINLNTNAKRTTVRRNSMAQSAAIDDAVEYGDKTDNDAANTNIHICDAGDYRDYLMTVESAEPVVAYNLRLIVSGNSEDDVESQIEYLNLMLSQRHDGLMWDSVAGAQRSNFQQLLAPIVPGRRVNTSTGKNYAGINFAVSPGLSDAEGLPIGVDVMSLAGTTSMMDFDSSLRRLAIIADSDSIIPRYSQRSDGTPVPASSVFAQAIANHACMRGHRAHHLVFNDYDYFESGLFWRPRESAELFARFDVSRVTINPLQGFGDINDVVNIFARLTEKIVNIFDVLEDFKLTQDDKAIILTAIQQFYFNQNLWIVNAELYPKRTRIVDIQKPETYPTMGTMINEFTTLAREAARSNRELKADRIDTLFQILNQAITSHMNVLGRTTSIKDPKAIQTYYEFANIGSRKMVQVQALNLIEYAIHCADQGDVLVLHGCDNLYLTVFKYLCETFDAALRKDVRIVLAFDQLTPAATRTGEKANIFDLKGFLYNDLDTDVDFSILGRCSPEEVDKFEKALNMQLSDIVRSQMVVKSPNQFLVHRSIGGINNFVYANLVI